MIQKLKSLLRLGRKLAVVVVFIALVTVLMLWLDGRFSPKIPAQTNSETTSNPIPPGATVIDVRSVQLPITESAVGTIQAVHETVIASRILARVIDINLHAGQAVKKNEVLVRLDDTDLQARLQQAQAAVDSAKAEHAQATIDEKRLASLIGSKAISQSDYDKARTAVKTTEANLARANEAVAEAQAVLGYATIHSPMDGVVVDKKVDVGDTVSPGQPLVTVYDPHHMQLVADVRESLARRLAVGQELGVRLDAMQNGYTARVSEIVPNAQSA
ncbi:MAG TPA: efflux RND transporter periplasmic adaptor subunit, partial [Tepidisphaeraceae bacterium]|nr:efflux RND transporter periplasmic adaptor subunit [Tepidisphaeraceae bacterium]